MAASLQEGLVDYIARNKDFEIQKTTDRGVVFTAIPPRLQVDEVFVFYATQDDFSSLLGLSIREYSSGEYKSDVEHSAEAITEEFNLGIRPFTVRVNNESLSVEQVSKQADTSARNIRFDLQDIHRVETRWVSDLPDYSGVYVFRRFRDLNDFPEVRRHLEKNYSDFEAVFKRYLEAIPEQQVFPHLNNRNLPGNRDNDRLDFDADVVPLARLIASEKVKPPIAIGVFGAWGSGKSFFMQQLESEIKHLTDDPSTPETRSGVSTDGDEQSQSEAHPPDDLFQPGEILHIRFNAWQYMQGNLWASMMLHIFKTIGTQRVVPMLFEGRTDLITRRLELTAQKDEKLAQLRQKERELEDKIDQDARRAAIWDAVKGALQDDEAFQQQLRQLGVEVDLHISEGEHPLHTLARINYNLSETGVGLRALFVALREPRNLLFIAGYFLLPMLAGLVLYNITAFAQLPPGVLLFATTLATATWHLYELVRGANKIIEEAQKKVDEKKRAFLEANEEWVELEKTIQALDQELERIQQQIDAIDQSIDEIQPTETPLFSQFIKDRLASDDYRELVGLLAIVKNDMDALKRYIHSPDNDIRIKRIVLYIDDLDRCPTPKVIQVLQAIHLLLDGDLFIAVVGVDVRWIIRSLYEEYQNLFEQEAQPTIDMPERLIHRAASPIEYMEKIFQIPIWIRQTQYMHVERLLQSHVVELVQHQPTDGANISQFGQGADSRVNGETQSIGNDFREIQEPPPSGVKAKDIHPFALEAHEYTFMTWVADIAMRSPRELDRFLNIYYLIKVRELRRQRVPGEGPFIGDSADGANAYRYVLFLLSLSIGTPTLARSVFQQLWQLKDASDTGTTIKSVLDELENHAEEESEVSHELSRLNECIEREEKQGAFAEWLEKETIEALIPYVDLVARYSFRLHQGLLSPLD